MITLTEETYLAILTYLSHQPWREVCQLIEQAEKERKSHADSSTVNQVDPDPVQRA